MSGHSKWKNIMHKKGKTDAERAKIFTKIGKEMAISIREGGADPSVNGKLRDLIAKAKSNNVPNDNIDRIIKKAAGADGNTNYEAIAYEGYGPCGVAVIVETTTDNRNRTGADIRHYFDKFGGNLGQTGCVSYMFTDTGIITVAKEDVDEDKLMEAALEAGASDFDSSDSEYYEITTEPNELTAVREALEKAGYTVDSADINKVPATYVTLDNEEDIIKMNKLLAAMDDNEDVQDVWHNWDAPEEPDED